MSMWMILRIRFLSIGRILLDLRPAEDLSSMNVSAWFVRPSPRRRAVHIIRQSLHIVLDAFYRFGGRPKDYFVAIY